MPELEELCRCGHTYKDHINDLTQCWWNECTCQMFRFRSIGMICPKCKEEGKKSIVRVGTSFMTAAHFAPFYDEEGAYHNHDNNRRSTGYSCSNGHRFTVTRYGSCKCGWSGGEDETKAHE